jgi:hypothetical protein
MRDGSDFVFENTESIPQVKRVVSGEGTVSDSDVNFIDVGLKINVKLRELSRGALLNLKVSNERIIELTPEGFSRINRTSVSSETPLNSTGVYLVAQTSYEEVSKGKVTFGFSNKKSTSTLQIFARVFKLDSKFKYSSKIEVVFNFYFFSGDDSRKNNKIQKLKTLTIKNGMIMIVFLASLLITILVGYLIGTFVFSGGKNIYYRLCSSDFSA